MRRLRVVRKLLQWQRFSAKIPQDFFCERLAAQQRRPTRRQPLPPVTYKRCQNRHRQLRSQTNITNPAPAVVTATSAISASAEMPADISARRATPRSRESFVRGYRFEVLHKTIPLKGNAVASSRTCKSSGNAVEPRVRWSLHHDRHSSSLANVIVSMTSTSRMFPGRLGERCHQD